MIHGDDFPVWLISNTYLPPLGGCDTGITLTIVDRKISSFGNSDYVLTKCLIIKCIIYTVTLTPFSLK